MGLIDAIRDAIHSRTYSRAGSHPSSDEPVPELDPYLASLVIAGSERHPEQRDRFVVKPEPVSFTAAGPGFDDPNITVTNEYPYNYADWGTDPADVPPPGSAPRP